MSETIYNGKGLNPYFTGLSILILARTMSETIYNGKGLNPYFTGLSILIFYPLKIYGGDME